MADGTATEQGPNSSRGSSGPYDELTGAVRELVNLMRQGDIDRLEVSQGDLHILLCAKSQDSMSVAGSSSTAAPQAPVQQTPVAETSATLSGNGSEFHHISSPMVGTFYEAPSPGERPYVNIGDAVEIGQTVAIIEAMKIMNEIVADRPGIVDEVMVENGETVEYGQPIFRIRPV